MCPYVYVGVCTLWNCVSMSLLTAHKMTITVVAGVTPWGSLGWGHGMWAWCPPSHLAEPICYVWLPEKIMHRRYNMEEYSLGPAAGDL